MSDRLITYVACMEELKRRYFIAEKQLAEFEKQLDHAETSLDIVAFQLRKMIELIGFASMSAHLENYKALKPAFAKEWKFSDIMRRIERINPDCLPRPVEKVRLSEPGIDWRISFPLDNRMEVRELIQWHGQLNVFAHAKNPFKSMPDVSEQLKLLNSIMDSLRDHMWQHLYMIEKADNGYVIELNDVDQTVSAFKFKAQGENDVH